MDNGFTVGAVFMGAIPKVDGSASLRFVTNLEVTEDMNTAFFRAKGKIGWLLFSEAPVQVEDIPTDNPDLETKSKAQRLRAVLYRKCEARLGRKPTDTEWTQYYNTMMEKIIDKFKLSLDMENE